MSQETEDAKYRLRGMFDAPTLQADRVIAATQALALHRIADALEPRNALVDPSLAPRYEVDVTWVEAWGRYIAQNGLHGSSINVIDREVFRAGWNAAKESK